MKKSLKKKLMLNKHIIAQLNADVKSMIRGGNQDPTDPYYTFVVNGCSEGTCSNYPYCSDGCGGGVSIACSIDASLCQGGTCDASQCEGNSCYIKCQTYAIDCP